jgi:hypothetical protein
MLHATGVVVRSVVRDPQRQIVFEAIIQFIDRVVSMGEL